MAARDISFFGGVDRNNKGEIISPYPCWYFKTHLRETEKEAADMKRRIDSGMLTSDVEHRTRREYEFKVKRIEQIRESVPKVEGAAKDNLYNIYKDLGETISDAMPTRTDMLKGFADAHDEARMMSEPCINADGKKNLYQKMGIEPQDGKVTRNQAAKAYKIIGRLLGENTNVERLRKDHVGHAYRVEPKLEEMG